MHILLLFLCLMIIPRTGVAAEKLVMQLKWFHQFQFAGYYAAVKQGYFSAEGFEVELRERDINRRPIDEVLEGKAQFSVADTSLVLERLHGTPVVAVAAIFQQSPMVLITLADANLTNPLDLKDKRVMFHDGVNSAGIVATFAELNMSKQDFEFIPYNFDKDSLIRGEVDAISGYLSNEPYYFQNLGYEVNTISPASYGIDFYGDMLFTKQEYLEQNPDIVAAFRRATIKGWTYAVAHPEQIIDWMQANLTLAPTKTKQRLLQEAQGIIRVIKPNLIEIGTLNKNRFRRIESIYKELKIAPVTGDLNNFTYTEYLDPVRDYQYWLYISWLILVAVSLIVLVFYAINRRLATLVHNKTADLRASEQALRKIMMTDELTGLSNRRKINEFLAQQLNKAQRYQRPLSVIVFDVDRFKLLNDTFGHSNGDIVLQKVSDLVKNGIRSTDLVGRWGGEEFIVICPETELKGASALAENIRQKIDFNLHMQEMNVTCSFGVAEWDHTETSSVLFSRCDKLLYQAKAEGRNRVCSSLAAVKKSA